MEIVHRQRATPYVDAGGQFKRVWHIPIIEQMFDTVNNAEWVTLGVLQPLRILPTSDHRVSSFALGESAAVSSTSSWFRSDSRANRLEAFTSVRMPGDMHTLWVRGPDDVVDQLTLAEPKYRRHESTAHEWTHALVGPGPAPSRGVFTLLKLLRDIWSIPKPGRLDFAVTLDWYKIPREGVAAVHWPNTEVGDLVNRGRYRFRSDTEHVAAVGRELVRRMCLAAGDHPLLQAADRVLVVPGHDSRVVSFGSRLAVSVAMGMGLPHEFVRSTEEFRAEAKALDPTVRAIALAGKFACDAVPGVSLIVDDVYHSGATMVEVARAARSAGATSVYAFTAVRTTRK